MASDIWNISKFRLFADALLGFNSTFLYPRPSIASIIGSHNKCRNILRIHSLFKTSIYLIIFTYFFLISHNVNVSTPYISGNTFPLTQLLNCCNINMFFSECAETFARFAGIELPVSTVYQKINTGVLHCLLDAMLTLNCCIMKFPILCRNTLREQSKYERWKRRSRSLWKFVIFNYDPDYWKHPDYRNLDYWSSTVISIVQHVQCESNVIWVTFLKWITITQIGHPVYAHGKLKCS